MNRRNGLGHEAEERSHAELRFSLLRLSAPARLSLAAALIVLLWGGLSWALS